MGYVRQMRHIQIITMLPSHNNGKHSVVKLLMKNQELFHNGMHVL